MDSLAMPPGHVRVSADREWMSVAGIDTSSQETRQILQKEKMSNWEICEIRLDVSSPLRRAEHRQHAGPWLSWINMLFDHIPMCLWKM